MIDYRLYLVTDDPSRYAGDWLDNVVAAVEGGVTCAQYRDTESPSEERYARVRRLIDALRPRHIPVIVNNDAELAAAVGAEGVHVGQGDLPPAKVRGIVGPRCEIGWSITDRSQLAAVPPLLPILSALGIGPVFDARKTKADASDALGLPGLAEIINTLASSPFTFHRLSTDYTDFHGFGCRACGGSTQPLNPCQSVKSVDNTPHHSPSPSPLTSIAIGGITLENAAEVLATGVTGLAVVSAFSKSPDPFSTARAFRKLFP